LAEQRDEQLMELEERYARYEVYDRNGEKIGKVGHLFVDKNDRPEYIGVKTGLFGLKSTLIPREMIRIDEERRRIEVAESKDRVKDAPDFDDEEEITLDYEREIHS
jgi:sporulation protein YlmC with PRC-barrel domain